MNLVILDLEWNAAFSNKINGFINEIIEFGAVKCDENLNVIDTFSSFVKLEVGKKLNSVVRDLTKIKEEDLEDAKPFMQVVGRFRRWSGKDTILMTWGITDIQTLIENCRYFGGSEKIPFLTKYVDAQKYCEKEMGFNPNGEQLGLNHAAEILNVDISELKHHRALGDSYITLKILKEVYNKDRLEAFADDCLNPEFYKRMTFRTSFIVEMNHPEVKKQLNGFRCERCGNYAQQLTKWSVRNKKFMANFRCRGCGYSFTGRVQLKQKYEGITVTKKSTPLPIIEEPRKISDGKIGNMNIKVKNGVGLLTFPSFDEIKGIKHAFSTRIGGKSKEIYASMNLGLRRGDDDNLVLENFGLFCDALGVNKDYLVTGNQDHHTNILRVGKKQGGMGIFRDRDYESIDGLCTNEKGVTLVIYAADCVPVYFYDPENKAIGLAHAGWRGTVADMSGTMVRRMQEEFGTNPEKLITAIGPSIGPKSFEVDAPCANEFLAVDGMDKFVTEKKNEKFTVDLWKVNAEYLRRAGVLEKNIHIGGVDSYVNSDLVFSHRKTRGQRGSNAAFLQIDENE